MLLLLLSAAWSWTGCQQQRLLLRRLRRWIREERDEVIGKGKEEEPLGQTLAIMGLRCECETNALNSRHCCRKPLHLFCCLL